MIKRIKNKNLKIIARNYLPYLLSFFIPALFFFIYFMITTKGNVLTVDLGQQYIDFLAFLRRNLFIHPFQLIYSFQNGLGGSMLATDAYYLLSPFNILIFLFRQQDLPLAIFIIITLKIGTCGISSYFYWHKKITNCYALAASSAYALSGYVIANYFNLMWLDSVILLPLLINAIDQILKQQKNKLILLTFSLWVTNFYTGFITLFFGLLYFLSKIFIIKTQIRLNTFKKYLSQSIIGSFLASFILFPVFFELLAGKAKATVHWNLSWQFNLGQELGKVITGAYNFHEMEAGLPNIFMTTPFLLLVIIYFLSQKISAKAKVSSGILLTFLVLSFSFTPFVLIWHLGQFPVWYPGRFSFVVIFLCINLGIDFLQHTEQLTPISKITLAISAIGLSSYWLFAQQQFTFITDTTLIIGGLFLSLSLIFFFFILHKFKFAGEFFYSIILVEVLVNLIISLNNLSYQNNRDYTNFAQNILQVNNYLHSTDADLYRSEKSFYRSDDDPFTGNYNGISNFNSISNSKTLQFLSYMGYLHNSNSVTNSGGTPLSDAILGVKYYSLPNYAHDYIPKIKRVIFANDNQRPDLNNYPIQKEFQQIILLKNTQALPLVFITNNQPQAIFKLDQPIINQQKAFQQIVDDKENIITKLYWPPAKFINVTNLTNSPLTFHQLNKNKPGKINFSLNIKNNNSIYLELPAYFNDRQATIQINHQDLDLTTRDSQNHLINLAYRQKGSTLNLCFTFKHQNDLELSDINLWSINNQKIKYLLQKFNSHQPKIYQPFSLILQTNTFTLKAKKRLASTIPANKNWLLIDKKHLLKQKLFMNTFLSANLSKGKHKLVLVYIPYDFLLGILLSLLTLLYLKEFFH